MESGEEEKEPKEEQKESGEEEKEPREEDKEPGEEHKESGEGVELLSRRNDEQAEEMGETQATRQHQTESHAGIPHAEIFLSKCRVNMVRVMMRKMVVCKDNDMEEESGSKDDDEAEMYATAEKFEISEKAKNDVAKVGEKEKESGDVQTETTTKRGEEKLMEKKGEVLRKSQKE
ncbi:unnamed protein product [Brassica oleracea var. botrytis]